MAVQSHPIRIQMNCTGANVTEHLLVKWCDNWSVQEHPRNSLSLHKKFLFVHSLSNSHKIQSFMRFRQLNTGVAFEIIPVTWLSSSSTRKFDKDCFWDLTLKQISLWIIIQKRMTIPYEFCLRVLIRSARQQLLSFDFPRLWLYRDFIKKTPTMTK